MTDALAAQALRAEEHDRGRERKRAAGAKGVPAGGVVKAQAIVYEPAETKRRCVRYRRLPSQIDAAIGCRGSVEKMSQC